MSWNTRELLAECLTALQGEDPAQAHRTGTSMVDGIACEVIVVDNASGDETPCMVRARFPWVRLLANYDNIGFARANNQAIRVSHGHYVLMLNPDACIQPGAVGALVDFMDTHPQAGAAGSRILNSDGSLQVSCYPAPSLAREWWRLFHLDAVAPFASYAMDKWSLLRPRRTDTVLGACLIVPRDLFSAIGLLDEDFFIYSEEVDLCLRIRQHGREVFWVPQATVVHHGAQSTRQVAAEMFLRLYGAKVLYFRKHHGGPAAAVYKIILASAAVARLVASPARRLACAERPQQLKLLADNYRCLLRALPAF